MYTEQTSFRKSASLSAYFQTLKKGFSIINKSQEKEIQIIKEHLENYNQELENHDLLDESFWSNGCSFKNKFQLISRIIGVSLILPFHIMNWFFQ